MDLKEEFQPLEEPSSPEDSVWLWGDIFFDKSVKTVGTLIFIDGVRISASFFPFSWFYQNDSNRN